MLHTKELIDTRGEAKWRRLLVSLAGNPRQARMPQRREAGVEADLHRHEEWWKRYALETDEWRKRHALQRYDRPRVKRMRRATERLERLEEEAQRREKAKDQSEATPRKSVVSNVTYSPEKVAPPGDIDLRTACAKQHLKMECLLHRIAKHQAGLMSSRLIQLVQFNTGNPSPDNIDPSPSF